MTSLLASALEARHIPANGDRLEAGVEGFWEESEGPVVLRRIHVHYRVRIPHGSRRVAERAVEVHERSCPLSQSVRAAIDVTYDAELIEMESE